VGIGTTDVNMVVSALSEGRASCLLGADCSSR
jgi:hypothetical protein